MLTNLRNKQGLKSRTIRMAWRLKNMGVWGVARHKIAPYVAIVFVGGIQTIKAISSCNE